MDLYQELILEHSKRPHGAGLREPFGAQVHHINPTCGDEVTLRVQVSGGGDDTVVTDVSYDALGCAISRASTSMLHDLVMGHSLREVLATHTAMHAMLTSRGTESGDEDVLGDGVALAGVAKYPARVKCALLGWMALTDALTRAGATPPHTEPVEESSPLGDSKETAR